MLPSAFPRFAAILLGVAACDPQAQPTGSDTPPFERVRPVARSGITITLRAAPIVVARGDTVRFAAVAHNTTAERIQVGVQCGPALDVRITPSVGLPRSVLAAIVGPNGVFTCELGPYHFAEPGDSLVNHLWWRAPDHPGEYVAVAGARGSAGLQDLGTPVRITVR